jgi:huntingtin
VVDEVPPGPHASKSALPSLPNAPSLSPIKRKAKGGKEDAPSAPAAQPNAAQGAVPTPQKTTPGKP